MELPSDLLHARLDLGTPAAANTDTGLLLVTPNPGGLGFRARIWVVSYQMNSAAHAAHIWAMVWGDNLNAATGWRMGGNYPVGDVLYFPGGFALSPNGRLTVVARGSIAGPLFYRAMAGYTIEAVT